MSRLSEEQILEDLWLGNLEHGKHEIEILSQKEELLGKIYSALFKIHYGDVLSASDIIVSILENNVDGLDPSDKLKAEIVAVRILLLRYQNEAALEKLTKIFVQFENNKAQKERIMVIWETKAYYLQSHLHMRQAEFQLSIEKLKKGINLIEDLEINLFEATLYNNLGNVYSEIGDTEQAEQLINKSLEIALKVENAPLCCQYGNLSEIYMRKGDLHEALRYGEDALKIVEQRCNPASIACYQEILGNIYFKMGNNERALQLIETGKDTRVRIQMYLSSAFDLRDLIRIELDRKNLDGANLYYENLVKLKNQHQDNDWIEYFCKFGEALILMQNKRATNIAKSQEIFTGLLHFTKLDNYEKIEISLNLCNLLIYELKIADQEEVVNELEEMIDQIYKIASELQSTPLLAEITGIRAKVKLIMGNIDEALELVENATLSLRDIGQARLKERISAFGAEIKDNSLEWKQIIANNTSFSEKIEKSLIENYIASSIKQRTEYQYFPT